MSRSANLSNQERADREGRRIVREAARSGRTVGYSLGRLIELKISVTTIRKVYRNSIK